MTNAILNIHVSENCESRRTAANRAVKKRHFGRSAQLSWLMSLLLHRWNPNAICTKVKVSSHRLRCTAKEEALRLSSFHGVGVFCAGRVVHITSLF